ncbi:hypothetical protein [Piscinibacter sakaiensis]|uniref:Uncharacterized protein n=1 Tax=Piscinibacter sakaiensis TaxID=1547922 RepID=A0A0K8NZR9_PISS1|nr:hypothetical protein [Piscinibacter sakaiensis]GAP35425.1 hypothetical protein ISF6_1196 [Piscinibacter sakaiensis]
MHGAVDPTAARPLRPAAGASPWLRLLRTAVPRKHLLQAVSGLLFGLFGMALPALLLNRRTPDPELLARGLVIGAGIVGWVLLVHGLLKQNTPVAAWLLPGQVRRLRLLLAGGWLLALAAIMTGLPARLQTGPVVLGVAALLAFAGAGMRWLWLWVGFWVVAPFVLVAGGTRLKPGGSLEGWAVAPWLVAAVLMLLGVALTRLLREGGAGHLDRPAGTWMRSRALDPTASVALPASTRWGRWLARLSEAPYHRWLRRCVSRPSSAARRAMLVFGPGAHWTVHLAWSAAVGLLVAAGLAWWLRRGSVEAGLWGPMIGLMSMALNPVFACAQPTRRTEAEQGLLQLAPGVPRGGAWRRSVARHRLAHFAVGWAAGAAGCGLLAQWMPPAMWPGVAVAVAAVLPSVVFVFPDLVQRGSLAGFHRRAALVACGGPVLALGLLHYGGVPAGALVAAAVAVAAAGLAWRWHALGRATPPLA